MPVQTTIQVRRDTAANWASSSTVLAAGEIGFETDTLRFKIGNGSSAYSALYYPNQGVTSNNSISTTTLPSSFTSSSLTKIGALSAATAGYVKVDASGNLTSVNETYLTTTAASSTYLTQSAAASTYLSSTGTAAKATNLAGTISGAGRLVVQTSTDTTGFLASATYDNQILGSNLIGTAVSWIDPTPFKVKTGIIAASDFDSSGVKTVTFTGDAFTQAPIVTLTPIGASPTTIQAVSLSSAPTASAFTARLRSVSTGSSTVSYTGTATAVYWIAIQYSRTSGSSQ